MIYVHPHFIHNCQTIRFNFFRTRTLLRAALYVPTYFTYFAERTRMSIGAMSNVSETIVVEQMVCDNSKYHRRPLGLELSRAIQLAHIGGKHQNTRKFNCMV